MEEYPRILTKNIDVPNQVDIDVYMKGGGYTALRKALTMRPEEITEEVKRSGLRGRGGAGFPTGVKWGFVPKGTGKPIYLCVNADEGEPGTFKDRLLMEKDPHLVLEGSIIASYALDVHLAFIYIRGEMTKAARLLEKGVREAREKGFLGKNILGSGYDLDIIVHRGAGGYICGEETALIESLEGKRGYPRVKPPFPAVVGLFKCPTVVNNVETLANLPWIINNGAEAYAAIGTPKSTGTRLLCLSGHINRPGVYELPMGIPLRKVIYEVGGGLPGNRRVKGVIPGGSSCPILTGDEIDVNMDFESLAAIGSMAGSGGVIVMDETTCMVWAGTNIMEFYAHESCGQCTPCREGAAWVRDIFKRIEEGLGREGDLELLLDIAKNVKGNTICPFGDAFAMPAEAFINKYRDEFEAHIRLGKCPLK